MATHDVIPLSKDAKVTSGRARKMRACTYSDDRIATVTPFTNNGRICSVPEIPDNNRNPDGFTVDTFAEYVKCGSVNRWPELVTAIGSSMHICNHAPRGYWKLRQGRL